MADLTALGIARRRLIRELSDRLTDLQWKARRWVYQRPYIAMHAKTGNVHMNGQMAAPVPRR